MLLALNNRAQVVILRELQFCLHSVSEIFLKGLLDPTFICLFYLFIYVYKVYPKYSDRWFDILNCAQSPRTVLSAYRVDFYLSPVFIASLAPRS